MKHALEITPNRQAHLLGVARRAAELGAEHGMDDERSQQDLFLLGYLHDVGYEFSDEQADHEEIGGLMLKKNGYRFWREVYHHGNPDAAYASELLDILNAADMQTSAAGERCSFDSRLADIARRYGEESPQYEKAKHLICSLIAKGF